MPSTRNLPEIVARYLAMPAMPDWDGPVYDMDSDRFHEDIDALVEAWWDDDIDPAGRIVRCCSESRAPVPDIEEYVLTRWYSASEEDLKLSEPARHLVEALRSELEATAPVVWALMDRRVDPAAIRAALNAISDHAADMP